MSVTSASASTPPTSPYKVIVAANNTPASYRAVEHAVDLCSRIKGEYKLLIVYFVALNPKRSLPYIDHLEKAYNMEIQDIAQSDVAECKEYFTKHYSNRVNYEFIEVEGESETGPLIEEYITKSHPDLNLLVVGQRALGKLERWALGSVSDYCLRHLHCPVTVVKDRATGNE
ncbi:Ubiquitin carboxyl-terminal hydrolase 22 [Borealophlyctis nickersoniae]|nr:Ubiquitin carboxyl-terminal hydrolase 22 [Borealophlyctis nickersoniae]